MLLTKSASHHVAKGTAHVMGSVTQEEIIDFIDANVIPVFYERKINSLNKLKIRDLLKRKNPYLFNLKNFVTLKDLVTELLMAHLSSQEETLLGGLLEQLAIFICGKAYGGEKSGITGMDLEFEKDSVKYIVAIKSGPNWGNSRQVSKLRTDFITARRTLGTNVAGRKEIIAVNGCCYGRDEKFDKGDYWKLCGQRFWELISGDADMYLKIAAPISEETRRLDEQFKQAYTDKIPVLVEEFQSEFYADEKIGWAKIVELVSAASLPVKPRVPRMPRRAGNSRRKKKTDSENQPMLMLEDDDT
jgi:hypothetical protein